MIQTEPVQNTIDQVQLSGCGFKSPVPSCAELLANHSRLLERNRFYRLFGYEPYMSVRFVLSEAMPLGQRVLDIGTGKGRFVIELARCATHVTTIDINPVEQRCAELEAVYAGVAHKIRFIIADARALPWCAASFDAVTSWNAFHHIADQARVFREMLRVLKPGGKLILADLSASGFRLMDAIHAAEQRRHPHSPSRFAHWHAQLQRNGFDVRRFEAYHHEILVARHRRGHT